MILANKQDLPNCMSIVEIEDSFNEQINCNNYKFFPTCATTGEGLLESFDWLSKNV